MIAYFGIAYLCCGFLSATVLHDASMSTRPRFLNHAYEFTLWFARVFAYALEVHGARKAIKALRKTFPELKNLDENLQTINMRDPLRAIVHFFDIMSKWQDKGGVSELMDVFNYSSIGEHRHTSIRRDLYSLQGHFRNAGRDPYGMNRTKEGQGVTMDDVFLGNICGLWTKPVREWLSMPVELGENELTHPSAPDKSPRQIVTKQAREFMVSHIKPISEIIHRLEAAK